MADGARFAPAQCSFAGRPTRGGGRDASPDIDALANLGLTAVGTDLGDQELDGAGLQQLVTFIRRARTIDVHPFVFGVRSADMVPMLAELGVDYISGPAICAPAGKIEGLSPIRTSCRQRERAPDQVCSGAKRLGSSFSST